MDKKGLEGAEERLIEINRVIEKLDPSIRPGAFELLKEYVASGGGHPQTPKVVEHHSKSPAERLDLAALIQKYVHDKPSDNAHLLAADWYRRYGSAPFALDAMKEAAGAAGLTVPEHLRMTFKAAQDGGKKLYQSAGRGLYKPTVTGELYLKKTYGVTKGTDVPLAVAKS